MGAAQGEKRWQDVLNIRTNSTVWRAPAGVEVVWYGEKDEDGGVWYWHRDTRVSWVKSGTASPGRYRNTGWATYIPVTMQRLVPAVLRASWPVWTRRAVTVVCIRRVLSVPCTSRCVLFPG